MKITDFGNTYHKSYVIYDNYRSISNLVDGQKSSSRKLFHCGNDFKTFSKVDTIANHTTSKTHYQHGSVNLEGVLKNMVSDYAGTNNLPLFEGQGFFGNRQDFTPGASRYVKAKISNIAYYIIRKEDYPILIQQEFEGYDIEPKFYVPIIPLIFINGGNGIGNGFSHFISQRRVEDIILETKRWIKGKSNNFPIPYYNGFEGSVSQDSDNSKKFYIRGELKVINTTNIHITELPIGYNASKYIKILNDLEDKGIVKSYKDKSNKNNFLFEVKVPRSTTNNDIDKLYKLFKLETSITENYTLVNENNEIEVFDRIEDIFNKYCNIRLEYYHKRKDHQLKIMEYDAGMLRNKMKFIKIINDGTLILKGKTKKELEKELITHLLSKFDNSYDYLLNMSIHSLTLDKVEELEKKHEQLKNNIIDLRTTDVKDIWLEELNELKKQLKKIK